MTSTHTLSCWIPVGGSLCGTGWPADVPKFYIITLSAAEIFSALSHVPKDEATWGHKYSCYLFTFMWKLKFWGGESLTADTKHLYCHRKIVWILVHFLLHAAIDCPLFYFQKHSNFFPYNNNPHPNMNCNTFIWRFSPGGRTFSKLWFWLDITKLINYILYIHQMLLLQFPKNYFFKAKEFVGGYRHKGCFVVKNEERQTVRNTGDILSHALWLCLSSLQTPKPHLMCYKTD